MLISIINSEQYFKRKDLKQIPWFALPNNILEHPDFFDVTGNEFKAFIWIIGVAAKTKKHEFTLDIRHAAYITQLNDNDFHSILTKLNKKRFQVTETIDDVTSTSRVRNGSVPNITKQDKTRQNKTRQDITIINTTTEPKDSVRGLNVLNSDKIKFKISANKEISISQDLLEAWSETYPKEFLTQSLAQARSWVLANEHKAPKTHWDRFLNSWFARGWETYRISLKSNALGNKITLDDLNSLLGVKND